MSLGEKIGGPTGAKAIFGSGLVWAWFDALFMSAFFVGGESAIPMPELATISTFLSCSLISAAVVARGGGTLEERLADDRVAIGAGACGCVASALLVLSGLMRSYIPLIAGGVLGGAYISLGLFPWAALYCSEGANSAVVYVSGAFACAFLYDVPLLFMSPIARAVFYCLFPPASTALLLRVPRESREFEETSAAIASSRRSEGKRDGLGEFVSGHLGLSAYVLGGMALVMVSFGYLQHLTSFSSVIGGGLGGNAIQAVRGSIAILLFAIAVLAPRLDGAAWRVGLLLMVAGFMLMPFLIGTSYFWVAGAVVIGGYTSFDLMNWTVFSQLAHAQSRRPALTIAAMRCLVCLCYALGAVAGLLTLGSDAAQSPRVLQLTIAVGYLVVVAIMLFMSSDDIRVLYMGDGTEDSRAGHDGRGAEDGLEERVGAYLLGRGLTVREVEISARLVRGRTQPWIAMDLGISENTVGTHMRHIYQKMGVHNRQDFIDAVLAGAGEGAPAND
jgi:DNA-binding CsgD family transcriptional regulator